MARDPLDPGTGDLFATDTSALLSPIRRRVISANAAILADPPDDIAYAHTVLAQCSLPYRPTDKRVWVREQGHVSLRIEAGAARHPDTGAWVDLPLPHGEKPRLVMIHLNGEALRTGSQVIDVQDSMTAFVRSLGIDTNGRNIRSLKDQLARLAAASVRFGIGSMTVKSDIISAFDLWWPEDAQQRALWPSTVRLGADYFASLQQHAVPLDSRAIASLSHSSLDLDLYAWLAQRLHRIPPGKPQSVTWAALKAQFGPDYDRLRKFREKLVPALRAVLAVYPSARIEPTDDGILLHHSSPPVTKRPAVVKQIERPTIDGTAVDKA